MRRIYLYNHKITGEKIFVYDEPAHYIKNVLRMSTGSVFYGFDGTGMEFLIKITSTNPSYVEGVILEKRTNQQKEASVSIELCISLCKTKTFENIIKKVSEIGVTSIIPMITTRSIINIDTKSLPAKIKRWEKIAAEGSKIAGRTKIPSISLPQRFETVISNKICGILFWEQASTHIKIVLNSIKEKMPEIKLIRIFIGPEGGFTQEEVSMAESNGIPIAGLGPRILSVETATIVAVSILMYEFEKV